MRGDRISSLDFSQAVSAVMPVASSKDPPFIFFLPHFHLSHSLGGARMNRPNVLACSTLVLFCLLLVAPVLAAIAVECPSTCSCLLPAKAKDLGYATYCYGKQMVCNDDPKNPMYCYENPTTTTVPELKPIVTTVTTTITKTVTLKPTVYPECPSGCLCTREEEAKAKGLVVCDGKKTLCGYDKDQTPLYCFGKPTTPAPGYATCSAGCSCLSTADAKVNGSTAYCGGKQSLCGTDAYQNPMYCFGKPATTTVTTTTTTVTPSKVSSIPTTKVPAAITSAETTKPTGTPALIPIMPSRIPGAVPCTDGCQCLDDTTIRTNGYAYCGDKPTICGFSKTAGELHCAQPPEGKEIPSSPQNLGILDTIMALVISIFGQPVEMAPAPQSTAYHDYCQSRFGLDSCDGYCVNLSADEDHCGSCNTACYSNEICCDGTCVRSTSADTCGSCGYTCPAGKVCQNGDCDPWGCYYGNTECSGVCVNTRIDPQNCESCGKICPVNSQCVDGECTPCPLNTLECNGRCTSSDTDRENCGSCRNTCSDDAICSEGSCHTCSGLTPTRCGDACTNVLADNNNCGGCGHVCPDGTYCSAGKCECPGYERGIQACPRIPVGSVACVDTMNDPDHCGGCGFGYVCRSSEVCCNGICINPMADPDNCGRCGNACAGDTIHGAGICRVGTCTYCDAGYYGCEASSGAVGCINIMTSPSNCGACGNVCPEGESCCDGVCTDTGYDRDNCGACGHDCISQICCGGVCKDFLSDDRNCGSCGNHCSRPDRGHCFMGRCCNAFGTNCE